MSQQLDTQSPNHPLPTTTKDTNLFDRAGRLVAERFTPAQIIKWTTMELDEHPILWKEKQTKKSGTCSKSVATTQAVTLPDQVRAIPLPIGENLWGDVENERSLMDHVIDAKALEDLVQETIISTDSTGVLVKTATNLLSSMWRRLSEALDIPSSPCEDVGLESVYQPFVHPVQKRLQSLATYVLISFWVEKRHQITDITPEFSKGFLDAIVQFGQIRVESEQLSSDLSTRSDFASCGIFYQGKPRPREAVVKRNGLEVDVTVDLKSRLFAEHFWVDQPRKISQTKDEFVTELLEKGKQNKYFLHDAWKEAGGRPDSWKTQALYLVAQVHRLFYSFMFITNNG